MNITGVCYLVIAPFGESVHLVNPDQPGIVHQWPIRPPFVQSKGRKSVAEQKNYETIVIMGHLDGMIQCCCFFNTGHKSMKLFVQ